MTKCPLCGSVSIIFDPARGEYYCGKCGYVIEQEQVIDEYSLALAQMDYENAKFELRKARDDNYNYAISEIRRIAANLRLPSYVIREAEAVFSKLKSKGDIQYRHISIEALAPACLLFAAYEFDYDLSFEDVYAFAKEDPHRIKLVYFKIITTLKSNNAKTNIIGEERK
ncbi:TFIIB-type zinc ribbon-containing protein [Palaeococcus sp. (in: euryarchaeotes)]